MSEPAPPATPTAALAVSAKQKAAEAKEWFNKFTQKNKDTIGGLGTVLSKAGGFVPLVGPAVTAVGDICLYFSDKAEADLKQVEEVKEALDDLEMHLETVASALTPLTEEQKAKSAVCAEIKVLFAALRHWAEICKTKKDPPDFLGSIKRKTARLQAIITAEQLKVIHEIDAGVKDLKVTTDKVADHLIRPLDEVYEEAKDFFKSTKWVESKRAFLEVQRRLKSGDTMSRGDNSKWYIDECNKKIDEVQPDFIPPSLLIAKGSTSPV